MSDQPTRETYPAIEGMLAHALAFTKATELCPRCGGEVHVHPQGRMCGCVVCKNVYRLPSMEPVQVEAG